MEKLALSLLFYICIVNSVFAKAVDVIPPQNKMLNTNNGRFVFGQISGARRDQYMLDTKTGRLWQSVKSKSEINVLQVIPYSDFNSDSYSIIPKQ